MEAFYNKNVETEIIHAESVQMSIQYSILFPTLAHQQGNPKVGEKLYFPSIIIPS